MNNARPHTARPAGGGQPQGFSVSVAEKAPREALISLAGPLTVATPKASWALVPMAGTVDKVVFDLSGLTALDLNGAAQLFNAASGLEASGCLVSIKSPPKKFAAIFTLAREALAAPMAQAPAKSGFFEEIGRNIVALKNDLVEVTTFFGELVAEFFKSVAKPSSIRWPEVFSIAETAGVNAVPISALVSFLVGLIIAFQSAMALQMFGMTIFVADMVGIAVVRELGPLITAIVLAGRSGSAFSAELGAMKAAEEVDAITTMGLSAVRELALPRVLASVLTTPLVTLLSCFMGIVGGSVVLMAMGISMFIYWQEAISLVSPATFYICISKSILFGFTVAAVGCLRGLSAGDGPGAVGRATTSGVVTNIVLIAVLDSLLAVLFYVLGI
ncbi:ABC transporter permease [Deltaproteobacteria bacterium OttesenSCG-928-K17]|nr:ABC transporter permease [Deltaproteobacteria bacterium OttesenSCG-928-K17]